MEEAVKENAELTRKERLAAWKESKIAAKPQAGAALKAGAAVKASAAPKANKPTAMRPGTLQPAKGASGAPSSSSQTALGKKRARSTDDDNATSAAAKTEPLQRLQKRLRGADGAAVARSAAASSTHTHTATAPARKAVQSSVAAAAGPSKKPALSSSSSSFRPKHASATVAAAKKPAGKPKAKTSDPVYMKTMADLLRTQIEQAEAIKQKMEESLCCPRGVCWYVHMRGPSSV
eukprot:978-Heterococcus_DN1.PRE.1